MNIVSKSNSKLNTLLMILQKKELKKIWLIKKVLKIGSYRGDKWMLNEKGMFS